MLKMHEESILLQEQLKTVTDKLSKARQVGSALRILMEI